ncbi:MAG: hypothetical protein KDJ52_04770 [Anaerolineae bacterium]|nr:hypothetical protein [Anaerolineae bacterium]
MMARQRKIVFYLAVGLLIGSGLVSLLSFAQFDPYLYVPQVAGGHPRDTYTVPANFTRRDLSAEDETAARPLRGSNLPLTISTPPTRPAPSTVRPAALAKPVAAPLLIAHNPANVRSGPGVEYALIAMLPAEQMTFIVGRNTEGTWLAIPAVGDAASSTSWVSAAVVATKGDINSVPVIPVSPLPPVPRYR